MSVALTLVKSYVGLIEAVAIGISWLHYRKWRPSIVLPVPIHFNLWGEADNAWEGAGALLLYPGLISIFGVLLCFIRVSRRRTEAELAEVLRNPPENYEAKKVALQKSLQGQHIALDVIRFAMLFILPLCQHYATKIGAGLATQMPSALPSTMVVGLLSSILWRCRQ